MWQEQHLSLTVDLLLSLCSPVTPDLAVAELVTNLNDNDRMTASPLAWGADAEPAWVLPASPPTSPKPRRL